MILYTGDRVRVFAHWHSRCGERAVVTRVRPLWVRFDGDAHEMTCEEHAVVREESVRHIGGAE